ncbi:MAG: metallophosphoesterase [Lachnospiraceae bacterium]|nr:metallophosphoesterase [Lachnospiraceae bacterium]
MNTFWVICSLIGLILLICIWIIYSDSNRFVVRYYEICNQKVKGNHRYVFVSDLHNKTYGGDHAKLMYFIRRSRPEAVLIGGDLLIAKPGEDFSSAVDFVRRLSEKGYPVYYANGNHEYRIRIYKETYHTMFEEYERAIALPGVVRLVDGNVYLDDANIVISGLEIEREYYRRFGKPEMAGKYVTAHVGGRREDAFTILLAHNPEYMDAYAEYGAELVLAGHMHGGVASLPLLGGVISPSFRLFPKYDGGLFQKDGTQMIVSRGLGMHTIPLRFLNPGELIVLDVKEG